MSVKAADSANDIVARGVKIIGETCVVPGSSLILDGKIGPGLAHVVGGFVARWALGPIGLLAVAANSYSKSITDQHLHEHVTGKAAG